jgi:hypothetical protein
MKNPELIHIKRQVDKGESQTLEFKLKTTHPMRILNEMVAFANSDGGRVLIGVNDDLQINGVKNSAEDIFLMEKLMSQHIYPRLAYNVQTISINKKRDLIIFDIPEGENKPYYVNEDPASRNGIAYVRSGDESIKAGKIMRMILNDKYKDEPVKLKIEGEVKAVFDLLKANETCSLEEITIHLGKKKRFVENLMVKTIKVGLVGFDPGDQDAFYLLDPD